MTKGLWTRYPHRFVKQHLHREHAPCKYLWRRILPSALAKEIWEYVNFTQYNAAIKGDESCTAFIDKVNVFIANSRSLYKARAKAREGATPKPRDAAALALPVNAAAGVAEGRINAA